MNETNYYSANQYYKKTYGEKVYRLSIDGGMTCPNRDGRVGFGGCTFCSESGSGDFTPAYKPLSGKFSPTCRLNSSDSPTEYISRQLDNALELVKAKAGNKFISYFQSFTNTYAPTEYLRECFSAALKPDNIMGLSIGTRPDCIDDEIISLLTELKNNYGKDIYVELGLQTVNDSVARNFNRGYDYSVFENALNMLNRADIPVIVHMILGLPNETPEDIYAGIKKVSSLKIHGIKLSLLHIIKGTEMEKEYLNFPERFHLMDKQTYIKTLCHCIELIPKNVVIYRITGDAPKRLLISPEFSSNKKDVLNSINKYIKDNNIIQGRQVQNTGAIGFAQ